MDKYVIRGGRPLQGEISISGAKNAAVAIIPAVLLVEGVCRLENIPQISDVDMLLTILEGLGAKVDRLDASTVEIDMSASLPSHNTSLTLASISEGLEPAPAVLLMAALLLIMKRDAGIPFPDTSAITSAITPASKKKKS